MDLLVTDLHSDMTQRQTEDSRGLRLVIEKTKSEAYCSQQWTEEYLQGSTNNLFGNALFLNRGDRAFQELSDAVGVETYWPWGASVGDLDDDGDLDLVTLDLNDRPQVLFSDLSERNPVRFVKVELVGTRSNRDGRGVRVEVRAGGRQWTRYHDGKSGYLGQSSLPLYFGLGESETAESVEVLWLSGQRQTIERLGIQRVLVVEEPAERGP